MMGKERRFLFCYSERSHAPGAMRSEESTRSDSLHRELRQVLLEGDQEATGFRSGTERGQFLEETWEGLRDAAGIRDSHARKLESDDREAHRDPMVVPTVDCRRMELRRLDRDSIFRLAYLGAELR